MIIIARFLQDAYRFSDLARGAVGAGECPFYEGENETYIEASAENSGSTLYDKEIRDKPRTRHTKRNV